MAFEKCIEEIKSVAKLAGHDFSDEDAAQLLSDLLDRKRRLKTQTAMGDNEALRHAASEAAEAVSAAAKLEKRNALLNLQARITRRDRIMSAPNMVDGIKAEIHGISTAVHGGRFSAEAESKALSRVYNDGLVTELEKAGLFQAARSGAVERDVARELFELSKDDGKPGLTGNKQALDIATTIHKYQVLAKENLNRAGAAIGDYSGYITRTSHDADKIRRAGYQAWHDAVLPALDDRTFASAGNRDTFLKGVYHALVTGVHMTEEGAAGWKDAAFMGPGNLAKRLSEGRVLHFKDADSWLDYHKQFGTSSVIESIVQNLDRAARSTALMRRWGTNPRAEFENDLRFLAESFRDTKPDAVVALRRAENTLKNRFGFLDGTSNQPVNRLGARISSTARVVESMAKLGGVALTHLSSAVTKSAELRYHGVGLLEAYGDVLKSFVRGRGHGETRELLDLLGAGNEGMRRDMISRFEPDDGMPGTLSKLANTFFKWSGLSYLVNAQKAGAEYMISRHLGSMLDREHGALPAETQRLLSLYRIDPAEWEAMRGVKDHVRLDGQRFLTPDAATRIAGLKPAAQQDLAIRLHALFNDIAERAIITPGIPEKALFLGANRPGTILGEGLRFIQQFKAWPMAAVRQGLGREVYGGQSKPAAIAGVLHIALGSAIVGYLAMSGKDLLRGQTPRDPRAPATWAAALMQGGGAGILGDYLLGEYSRFGHNFAESLLGPVLGTGVNSVVTLYNDAKEGKDVRAESLRMLTDNLPFANLVYARLALNYMFLWQVQEALSPGYMHRWERRVEQQQHHRFWLSPAKAVAH